MALKHGSSSGIGMLELMDIVQAFEEQNRVLITVSARRVAVAGKMDWQWEAKAWEVATTLTGRPLLASAQLRCGEKRLVTMEAVVLQLLYALDFQLGQGEMQGREEPRA